MKKIFAIITVLTLVLLSGCSYVAYKDYYNNSEDYEKIWQLAGFYGENERSSLFPETVEGLDIKEYFCRYDEALPLGEGVQLHIKIQYNKEAFENEIVRISLYSNEDNKNFTHTNATAYCVNLGKNGSWEYALTDSEKSTISYIYIKDLPKSEIEIDGSLLPQNYIDYGYDEE